VTDIVTDPYVTAHLRAGLAFGTGIVAAVACLAAVIDTAIRAGRRGRGGER
jgi:hypothetical protein